MKGRIWWRWCWLLAALSACGETSSNQRDDAAAGAAGESALDPAECFSPNQNLDRAAEPGATGCPCSTGVDADTCAPAPSGAWVELSCQGQWVVADHGACALETEPDCSSGPEACAPEELCATNRLDGGRHCTPRPPEVTGCVGPGNAHECCMTSQCASGTCVTALSFPSGQCGLGGAAELNRCLADACRTDADCAEREVCAYDGAGDQWLRCMPARCRTDADCGEAPGGHCVWTGGDCCGAAGAKARSLLPRQLACVYPGDWCRRNVDCARGTGQCVVHGDRAECSSSCE